MISAPAIIVLACTVAATAPSRGDPVLLGQFNPGQGQLVSAAYDPVSDSVWVYGGFAADLRRYSREGAFLASVPRPGEAANDVDIEVAHETLTLGSTIIPAGTILFVNGENGVAEIYAVDPASGSVLATLVTAFGVSHVVGGSWHPGRDTFFLVQDRVPSGGINDNVVAEIDPASGSVLGSFRISDILPDFTVNFGDIEVGGNGNLLVVSSDEDAIGEFTPAGAFMRLMPLPDDVSSISGIGFDDSRSEAWVSGTGGNVWRLGLEPPPCRADCTGDGRLNVFDFLCFQTAFSDSDPYADYNQDGVLNVFDFLAYQTAFSEGC